MRLWSLHPHYLDARGLVALWREGLLARAVLQHRTKGYQNHPQLDRFKAQPDPLLWIDFYLKYVYIEGTQRGYHFDARKLGPQQACSSITVTSGQLRYEMEHLKNKLKVRDKARYEVIVEITEPEPHPLFIVVEGEVEIWERHLTSRFEKSLKLFNKTF
jgi:hypothetical protein